MAKQETKTKYGLYNKWSPPGSLETGFKFEQMQINFKGINVSIFGSGGLRYYKTDCNETRIQYYYNEVKDRGLKAEIELIEDEKEDIKSEITKQRIKLRNIRREKEE